MASQAKHYPKDAQVIMSIMKDMGINEFDPRVLNQLLEFAYRYVTSVLEDARVYANHAKKKIIDLDDVRIAVNMMTERCFTTPPPRDILLEVARTRNSSPLPLIKPHCGLRLPPDRYCLISCNYRLQNSKKPQPTVMHHMSKGGNSGFMANTIQGGMNSINSKTLKPSPMAILKRPGSLSTISRTQTITLPKPVIKISTGATAGSTPASSPQPKPKIQVATNLGGVQAMIHVDSDTSVSESGKRKRDDDSFGGQYFQHRPL